MMHSFLAALWDVPPVLMFLTGLLTGLVSMRAVLR